ncbi:hypothetical protein ACFFWB_27270 [Flavobacterium procerum]
MTIWFFFLANKVDVFSADEFRRQVAAETEIYKMAEQIQTGRMN